VMSVPVALTLCVYLFYFRQIPFRISTEKVRMTFAVSKWLALFTLVTALHARADIYLLEFFSNRGTIDPKETGIFSAAFSLVAFINLVTATFAEAVLPKVSQESNHAYFVQLLTRIRKTLPYVLIMAAALIIVLYFLFRYGFEGKYIASIDCMIFICVGMIFLFYMHTINTMFYPLKRTDLVFKIILAMFAVNILVGYLLIPVWGAVGAAITNTLVSFVGLVLTAVSLKRILKIKWTA
jgi:O-antigen/teichoic acid export membrane protein